jgi:hypothetical protein
MTKDQRKALRRQVEAPGYIYTRDGRPLGECRMKDVSAGGAKLSHSIADKLPDQFLLSLSKNGNVLRRCEIAWRGKDHLGVRFLASGFGSDEASPLKVT